MTNTTKDNLLDIAAELIVAPLACYAYVHDKAKKFAESETGQKTMDAAQSAGKDMKEAAKKAMDSDLAKKAKEGYDSVKNKTASSVKDFSERVGSMADDILKKAEETPEECDADAVTDDEKCEEPEACENTEETAGDAAQTCEKTACDETQDMKESCEGAAGDTADQKTE